MSHLYAAVMGLPQYVLYNFLDKRLALVDEVVCVVVFEFSKVSVDGIRQLRLARLFQVDEYTI